MVLHAVMHKGVGSPSSVTRDDMFDTRGDGVNIGDFARLRRPTTTARILWHPPREKHKEGEVVARSNGARRAVSLPKEVVLHRGRIQTEV